jgi:isocitrate lyase
MAESDVVYPSLATAVAKVESPLSTEARHPKEAALALEMLGEGKSFRQVADQTGLTLSQIGALRKRHKVTIDEHRERFASDGVQLAENLRLVALAKLQQLADDPEQLAKTNIRDLMLPYAIAQDKVFSALGENTVVVEHRSKGASLEDAQKAIEEARAKIRAKSIEVVVTPSE